MTIKELLKQIADTLSSRKIIKCTLESDNSLLIRCNDKSRFLIHIIESKSNITHNKFRKAYINTYLATHSDTEFAQDILDITNSHPTFFLYFMIFAKLKELDIIDQCMFYHILDNVIEHEQELNDFLIALLTRHITQDK